MGKLQLVGLWEDTIEGDWETIQLVGTEGRYNWWVFGKIKVVGVGKDTIGGQWGNKRLVGTGG